MLLAILIVTFSYFPIWTSMKGFLRLSFKKLVRIYVCSLIISVVTRKQKERSIKVSSHFLESWFLKGPKTNPASRLCPLCAENQMPKICSKSSTISSSYFKEGRNWEGREDGGCCCGGETRSGFALQQKKMKTILKLFPLASKYASLLNTKNI